MSLDFSILKSLGVIVEEKAALWKWTTFQLGGACPFLFLCSTPEQLESTIVFLVHNKIKFILIGGGSNLVISDQGLNCAVVRYVSTSPLITHTDHELTVSGSTVLDTLAQYAAEHALEGLNYTSGIPGTVGGAIVGNAGAFGKQVGDVLKKVTLLSVLGKKHELKAEELGFTYRNSVLKETGDIVVSAVFVVKKGNRDALLEERAKLLKIRHEKHPDLNVYPCAGSFFRNIEPTSKAERRQATGWFLEQAGGKNLSAGGAAIFDKHANIIVKGQGCTAHNVYELSQKMAQLVKKTYDMDIIREVRFVGKFDGVDASQKDMIW
ncbi:MAG: UDP-N-acetylmuramate dehydrogenase [Candidatus Omnitrophica bacterium]|nr:UDP-N-acetylmuramate dehydrogenase [Candidatus Omnitrophota bacterium]